MNDLKVEFESEKAIRLSKASPPATTGSRRKIEVSEVSEKLTRQESELVGGGELAPLPTSYRSLVRLDHVSYAVSHSELSDTVQRLGAELGAAFKDGGRHPQFGTCNFVLPLAGGMYVEIVAPLDHPAAERAPFAQAVRKRAEAGGGWLGWVVSVSDMSAVESRLGRPAVPGHRRRPDGYDLQWQQVGVNDLIANPQLPFFIKWESPSEEHPSAGGAVIELAKLQIVGDADAISEYLGEPKHHPLEDVEVEFLAGTEAGLSAVTFRTAGGLIAID